MSHSGEGFLGHETILYNIIVETCHYTFVKTHRMYDTKSNLTVNYGL